MRQLLIVLIVVAVATVVTSTPCKSTCIPSSLSDMPADVQVYRQKTFQCLFDKADKDKNGKIDYKEYSAWRDKYVPWRYKIPTIWSAAIYICNCDCDESTISWEDLNGTTKSCLHDLKTTDFAYNMLCK